MGGVKKCGGRCGKVFWVLEKVKRGVGKCVGVWGSVLGCCRCGGRCGKVFWVLEKVKRGVGKCVGVWGSNGGEV